MNGVMDINGGFLGTHKLITQLMEYLISLFMLIPFQMLLLQKHPLIIGLGLKGSIQRQLILPCLDQSPKKLAIRTFNKFVLNHFLF